MSKFTYYIASVFLAFGISEVSGLVPLAQNYVEIARSEDSRVSPLYSPSIIALSSDNILVSYTRIFKKGAEGINTQVFMRSSDGGKSWKEISRIEKVGLQGRVFRPEASSPTVYYIGTGAGLPIYRSNDLGKSWSAPSFLSDRKQAWHQTAANVVLDKGNVYLAMDKPFAKMNAWGAAERGPVLLRAKAGDNLLDPKVWTFSDTINFADIFDGFRKNNPDIDWFGIPFYPSQYPNRKAMGNAGGVKRTFSPMGWCETNVVKIFDPNHYWYDADGKTYHMFLRLHCGVTNLAAVVKAVENDDGTISVKYQDAPSGKHQLFVPFPGGQMRFHMLYDDKTKTYWLLSTQSTDSMARADTLSADRFDLAFQERNRLTLHFSKNAVDWCFAGLVCMGGGDKESRHYASMDFDGNDIVIASRSGDSEAHSAHETNMITFHRVKNFRKLIY